MKITLVVSKEPIVMNEDCGCVVIANEENEDIQERIWGFAQEMLKEVTQRQIERHRTNNER